MGTSPALPDPLRVTSVPLSRRFLNSEQVVQLLARREVGEVVVPIDVRPVALFEAGHLPGARSGIQFFAQLFSALGLCEEGTATLPNFLARYFSELGLSGTETLLFCGEDPESDIGSPARGAFLARVAGFDPQRVFVFEEGMRYWRGAKEVGSTPAVAPGTLSCQQLNLSELALAADLRAILHGHAPGTILDVRTPKERQGEIPWPRPNGPQEVQAGSVPNSRFIPFVDFLDTESMDTPRFRSAEEVRSLLTREGVDLAAPIIVLCYRGSRSAVVMDLLKSSGATNVRSFLGGWDQIGRRLDLLTAA